MKTIASSVNTTTTTSSVSIGSKNESAGGEDGSGVQQQFQTPNAAAGVGNKRPISLDLNKQPAKKQRLVGPSPLILESPDLHNLKTPSLNPLNTPDIEKILLSSNLLQTPDPGAVFPTAEVRPVTSAQEAFGKGFDEALYSLHNSKNSQTQLNTTNTGSGSGSANEAATVPTISNPITNQVSSNTVTGMSGGSFTYTNLDSSFPVAIKDEPHISSGSPPVSPIDMETQEKIKLERKRQRNRVAASKCRKRKLERISKLEDKVKILKGENTDLGSVVKNLKDHVAQLKQQVIQHIETGCSVPTMYNGNALLQGK